MLDKLHLKHVIPAGTRDNLWVKIGHCFLLFIYLFIRSLFFRSEKHIVEISKRAPLGAVKNMGQNLLDVSKST